MFKDMGEEEYYRRFHRASGKLNIPDGTVPCSGSLKDLLNTPMMPYYSPDEIPEVTITPFDKTKPKPTIWGEL